MIKFLIPIVLGIIGTAGGVGAAKFLVAQNLTSDTQACSDPSPSEPVISVEYAKLNNQFIIPVLQDGKIGSLVVASLSVEIPQGQSETIYKIEPKLRDLFLQVLFEHANLGGFAGTFTKSDTMENLRERLLEAAKSAAPQISGVLITDIARQDHS